MRRTRIALLVPLLLLGCVVPSGIARSDAIAVPPSRVLDTRAGLGAPVGRLTPGTTLALPMAAAVATGAASVSVNLTATDASGPGYLTAWPCGQTPPATSILNFTPGRTVANLANVGLGTGGVCLASSAPVHVVADVMGWFTGSSEFRGSAPTRLLDTRTGTRFQVNEERRISLAAGDGLTTSARAAALNITVVSPQQDGFVTIYPCGSRPIASTVNFRAGEIVPNFTLVPFTANEVCAFSSAATDLVVDSFGWSDNSAGVHVIAPARILDTRSGEGWSGGPASPATTVELPVA